MIDYSNSSGYANLLDFHLHQDSLYLVTFLAAALLGMLISRFFRSANEEICDEIELEVRRL